MFPSLVLVAGRLAQLDAAVDPGLVPVPDALDIHAKALPVLFRVLSLPHVRVFGRDAELREASGVDGGHNVGRPELRLLDFLLHPEFLVDRLCRLGVRVQELDHAIRLSRPVDELLVEEQAIRVLRAVVLVVVQPTVKLYDVGKKSRRDVNRRERATICSSASCRNWMLYVSCSSIPSRLPKSF